MTKFNSIPLPDVVFFQEGPGLRNWQWTNEGMKVINVTNILGDGNVDVSNTDKYISINEFEERYSHFAIDSGDIVVASSGNTYGKVGRIFDNHLPLMMNTSVVRFHSNDTSRLDDGFLYVFLRSRQFKNQIERFVTGGAQPNFGPTHIKKMWISLPPISIQKKMANIVKSYDDLIENNRRRIELLEQAARLLYKEWFVHFRFPGHEHVKMVDGVPEGWESKLFRDVCETVGGGTPSTKVPEYWENGDITWVTPTDVTRNKCLALLDSVTRITEAGLRSSSAKLVPPNTILMTSRASIGYFALVDREVCTNQGFINIIPNEGYLRMYLLQNLISRVDEIRAHAGGSTYPEISKGKFRELPIIMPDKSLLKQFSEKTEVILSQTRVLLRQISALERARDLLLPRLMNGEIAV